MRHAAHFYRLPLTCPGGSAEHQDPLEQPCGGPDHGGGRRDHGGRLQDGRCYIRCHHAVPNRQPAGLCPPSGPAVAVTLAQAVEIGVAVAVEISLAHHLAVADYLVFALILAIPVGDGVRPRGRRGELLLRARGVLRQRSPVSKLVPDGACLRVLRAADPLADR